MVYIVYVVFIVQTPESVKATATASLYHKQQVLQSFQKLLPDHKNSQYAYIF